MRVLSHLLFLLCSSGAAVLVVWLAPTYVPSLSPVLAVPTSLTPPVARSLTRALRRIEEDDDVTAVSTDLAARFPPPDRADLAGELGQALSMRGGRGLFGNSEVWITQTPSRTAAAVLRASSDQASAVTVWPTGGPR